MHAWVCECTCTSWSQNCLLNVEGNSENSFCQPCFCLCGGASLVPWLMLSIMKCCVLNPEPVFLHMHAI